MKRLTALIIIAALLFTITGCAAKKATEDAEPVSYEASYYSTGFETYESIVLLGDTLYGLVTEYKSMMYSYYIVALSTDAAEKKTINYIFESLPIKLCADSDGYLWILEHIRRDSGTINKIAVDGTPMARIELDFSADYMFISADGTITAANNRDGIQVLSELGELQFEVSMSGIIDIVGIGGQPYALKFKDAYGYELIPIDLEEKKTGEAIKIAVEVSGVIPSVEGTDYDFLYYNDTALYGYIVESSMATEIVSFGDMYIGGALAKVISPYESGYIVYDGSTKEIVHLRQVADIKDKTVLTLATYGSDHITNAQVNRFNRTNSDYEIKVIDYAEGEGGLTRLNAEIIAGNTPDIFDTSSIPVGQYSGMGLFEDLYPYLDSDAELGRESIVENVLRILDTDGKLYQATAFFRLYTVVGKASTEGFEYGWTFDDLMQISKDYTESEMFAAITDTEMLSSLLRSSMDEYIDWINSEVYFDSESFRALLEYCATLPAEPSLSAYDTLFSTDFRSDKVLFKDWYFDSFIGIQYYEVAYGEPVKLVGYPGSGRSGALRLDCAFAMSSKSPHKDAAWSFIRTFLTEDYQLNAENSMFFTNKNALESMAETAMIAEYYTDADGNQVQAPKDGGFTLSVSDNVDFTAATKEQIELMLEAIDNADSLYMENDEIIDIVLEEAEIYFTGGKSVEETAKIIHSRVGTLVNERGN